MTTEQQEAVTLENDMEVSQDHRGWWMEGAIHTWREEPEGHREVLSVQLGPFVSEAVARRLREAITAAVLDAYGQEVLP